MFIKKTVAFFLCLSLLFIFNTLSPINSSTKDIYAKDNNPLKIEKIIGLSSQAGIFRMASQDGSNFYPMYQQGMAVDSQGNVYIADNGESEVEVFSPTLSSIRNFGSIGSGDGQFQYLTGLAIDKQDFVYGADAYLGRIVVFDDSGKFIQNIGEKGTEDHHLQNPAGLAFLPNGDLLVADFQTGVKVFSPEGSFRRVFSTHEMLYSDSPHEGPVDIKVDEHGFVYVLMISYDSGTSQVLCYDQNGQFMAITVPHGTNNDQLSGIATGLSINGNLLFVSNYNFRSGSSIKKYELSDNAQDQANFLDNMATHPGSSEGIKDSNVILPTGVVSTSDQIFYLDGLINRLVGMSHIKQVLSKVQCPVMLYGIFYGNQPKPKGYMSNPQGVRIDGDGYLYVADSNFGDVVIFDDEGNEFDRIAVPDYSGGLANPADVIIDEEGFIYVSDMPNSVVQVFDPDYQHWMVIDEGFNYPQGLSINHDGDLLVVNSANSTVSKIDIMDVIDEEAFYLDMFYVTGQWPVGISIDSEDNMALGVTGSDEIHYLSKKGDLLHKIGETGSNPGQLKSPQGVWIDAENHIYVAETENGRIQKFTDSGELLWASELQWPGLTFIAQGPDSKLYVSDCLHNVILVIDDETAADPGIQDPSESNTELYLNLASKDPLYAEEPFTVSLEAKELSNIHSIQLSIHVSCLEFELIDINLCGLLEEGSFEISNTTFNDQYLVFSIQGLDNDLLNGDGCLVEIIFKSNLPGDHQINFDKIIMTDHRNRSIIPKELHHLTVTVNEKDLTPPVLNVEAIPEVVYEEILIIRGSTEVDATLTINEEHVSLQENGSFIHDVQLNKGENAIIIIATDPFGNTTSKEFSVWLKDRVIIKLQIGNRSIMINGIESVLDAAPFIDTASGRTLVPIRAIVEAIDGKIGWEASEQKVTIEKDSISIELWIGKPTAMVNGKEVRIDAEKPVSPVIVSGRTFLPLRFVAENLGFKVEWDGATQVITLSYPDLE